ncbi:MAG: hypothetical protein ABIP20_15855, partial [Chthoniobacteraceae bacterium]
GARFAAVSVHCVVSACSVAAAAAPHAEGWRHWVSDKVLACGAAAVALFVLSLLLRGLLKVLSLVLVIVLIAGAFWFLRDTWRHRAELLPHEWTALADRTLESPKAQIAWQSVQAELGHLSASARERLAAGTDSARRNVQAKLEAKARELRKEGSSAEADQIAHLAELMGRQK